MPLKGVLLDIDGTLVDSNDAHALAWVEGLHEHGHDDISFTRVRPLIGMGGDKVLPSLTGISKETSEGKCITDRVGEIFRARHLATVHAFPGVRELLLRMRDDGLTLVVATSASSTDMKKLLEVANITDLISDTTNSEDADESKPEPDIVEVAVERAGHEARDLVMLGDTPYDVEAATRAGVRLVAVRCGGWWADDAFDGAAAIYDDPADLLADYASSPLSRKEGRTS